MKALFFPESADDALFLMLGDLWLLPLCYLLLINLTALFLMWWDKRRSKRAGARRIRERTLFLSALLGGSIGAIAGMWIFRHKTKHWYFVWGIPLILAAQLLLGAWCMRRFL